MKLLVTGASGFIGYEVSRQLAAADCRPKLMIRRPGDDCEICRFDAKIVQADLTDFKSLKQAVKGIDGIIHLGARATFESYDILKPSILDGSTALMAAGIDAGIRTFVYSSSLLVYRGTSEWIDARTPVNPVLDYGRIKVDTENKLKEMAASAGISFAALRLPHVYGGRDLYFRQLRSGRLILPGPGNNIYTHLHVADAAAVIIACAQQAYSGILPFGDLLPATWESFSKVVKPYYPKARIIRLPQWLALAATFLLSPFRRFRSNRGLETPGAVRTYNFNLAVNPNLLWKDIHLTPKYPTIYQGIPVAASEKIDPAGLIQLAKSSL